MRRLRYNQGFQLSDHRPTVALYTSSSLTLRSLLKAAASRLRLGVPAAKVSGLTWPAKAMFAAVAAAKGRTLLVVPTDADVETLTGDARFFFSALEGLSPVQVERSVSKAAFSPSGAHGGPRHRGRSTAMRIKCPCWQWGHRGRSGRRGVGVDSGGAVATGAITEGALRSRR